MKNTLLFLLLFLPFISMAQIEASLYADSERSSCEVSGIQNGTWDYDTIFVVGDVEVPVGNSLIVAEGTKVIFKDYFSIKVNGGFEAVGCEEDSIYFTIADTTGFYLWNSGKGGWNGIVIQDTKEKIKMEYCHFSYGKAAGEENRLGGALRLLNVDEVEINNCTFYHNFTSGKGGAMYAEDSDIFITNCEIDGNLGYNEDGEYMHGGGFQFLKCNVNMEDMYFHDNYCTSCYGGGVNFDSCNVVLNKAIFEDNYAVNAGGLGIQRSNGMEVRVSNILLNNNLVYHYGGAMAIAKSSPLIQNVTMANNKCIAAGGGAMQFYDEACPIFKNCIIWGNGWYDENQQHNASQIFIWGGNCSPSFYNSVLDGGLKDVYGNEYVKTYEDMIEEDPLFVDTTSRNYKLTENSPVINKGTIDTTNLYLPDTDLAGMPRILGGIIDMGCYEYSGVNVQEIMSNNTNLIINPNPITVNSVCEFELDKPSNVTVSVYDLKGTLVIKKECGIMPAGENVFYLSEIIPFIHQNNNVFFLTIKSQDNTLNAKFIY